MNLLIRRRLTLVLGEQIQNSNVMNNFGFECRNKTATPKRPKSWTNDYSLLWCGVGVGYCFKPAFLTQQQVKQYKEQKYKYKWNNRHLFLSFSSLKMTPALRTRNVIHFSFLKKVYLNFAEVEPNNLLSYQTI